MRGRLLAAAVAFNAVLGPGALESGHKSCLEYQLPRHGIAAHRQEPVPIRDEAAARANCWLAINKIDETLYHEGHEGNAKDTRADGRLRGLRVSFVPFVLKRSL